MTTFMPAPGWPAMPAGWLPEQSWNPPATWPPAPPSWVFYRGALGEPVSPPPGHWQPPAPSALPFVDPAQPMAPGAPTPASKKPGRLVLGLLIGAVAVSMIGAAALLLLLPKGPPELTLAQFEPYGKATMVGSAPNLGMQPSSTDWNLDPDSEVMQVPACRSEADFHDAHTLAVFATPDAFHSIALMDTRANLAQWLEIINQCTTDGLAAGAPVTKQVTGETDGVKWSYIPNRISLYYGNVTANITVLDCEEEIPDAVQAFKEQVNALR